MQDHGFIQSFDHMHCRLPDHICYRIGAEALKVGTAEPVKLLHYGKKDYNNVPNFKIHYVWARCQVPV